MIIDSHAHVFAFPKLKNVNYNMPFLTADEQIKVMDAKGIDKAIILPLHNNERYCEPQSFGEILYICEKCRIEKLNASEHREVDGVEEEHGNTSRNL